MWGSVGLAIVTYSCYVYATCADVHYCILGRIIKYHPTICFQCVIIFSTEVLVHTRALIPLCIIQILLRERGLRWASQEDLLPLRSHGRLYHPLHCDHLSLHRHPPHLVQAVLQVEEHREQAESGGGKRQSREQQRSHSKGQGQG